MKICDSTIHNPEQLYSLPIASYPHFLIWSPQKRTKASPRGPRRYIAKKPIAVDWPNNLHSLQSILPNILNSPLKNPDDSDPPINPDQPICPILGLGFAYTLDHPFVCVDLDDLHDDNLTLANRLNSYTEYSPSGKGLHIIIALPTLEDKQKLHDVFNSGKRDTKNKRDLYIASGFVTITNKLHPDYPPHIRTLTFDEVNNLLQTYFFVSSPKLKEDIEQQKEKDKETAQREKQVQDNDLSQVKFKPLMPAQVRTMLQKLPVQALESNLFDRLLSGAPVLIDPECTEEARTPWLIIGQAIHHNFKGSLKGYQLFQEWSEKGNKYSQQDCEAVWNSFKNKTDTPITVSTLVKLVNRQAPDFPHLDSKQRVMDTIPNMHEYLRYSCIHPFFNVVTKRVHVIVPDYKEQQWGIPDTNSLSLEVISTLIQSDMRANFKLAASAFPAKNIKHYLRGISNNNIVNPIKDYFIKCAQNWDKRDYIEPLMRTIITPAKHARLRPSYRLFIRKWLLQVVAAAAHDASNPPRLNRVLIFQGPQNIGKTKWVESLFPEEIRKFCSADKDLKLGKFKTEATKLAMELTNTLICNINEIDRLFKSSSYPEFKAFLDQTVDQVVLPYGEAPVEMSRRTVFIGSTNEDVFLVDKTGNRRVEIIQADKLEFQHGIDINQLWGQIYSLYASGEVWWLNEDSDDPLEIQAIADRDFINSRAMALRDDSAAMELDEAFNSNIPYSALTWNRYTLKDIRAILGMSFDGPRSSRLTAFKDTLTVWLSQIPGAPKPEKGTGPRARVYYWMPPLRDDSFPAQAFVDTEKQQQLQ